MMCSPFNVGPDIESATSTSVLHTTTVSTLADQTRWMDAVDQAALIASGEVSPGELLEAAIERIEGIDPVLNAVVIRWFDHARDTAAGDVPEGPFRGVPFLIKDLFATYAGQRISSGNLALKKAHVISEADTTLVSRHCRAGLVIAGRTNSPELGSVPTTEPIAWGPTRNPWDTTRSPGGSSGGAAAAVASGTDPGRLRIGILDHHPQGGRVAPECTAATRAVGSLLDSLGHDVEHGWPKALDDNTFQHNLRGAAECADGNVAAPVLRAARPAAG
jgi:Asp-tRNA(Asn)/Glu-tRNA(Gln) amidotransferase A subunit family amidase